MAGLIVSFGKDIHGKQIDFNSVVEKDMVLATIDPVPYQAAVADRGRAGEFAGQPATIRPGMPRDWYPIEALRYE